MDRLEQIVDMIKFEDCLADIGCDHGYVGLELFKEGKIKSLIATDISKPCLEKSNELFKNHKYNYEGRLGDGLKPIGHGEADAVIIAGMGGDLIAKIVTDDIRKTRSIKKFIIQPMTEPDKVRETFYGLGFNRTRDLMVREKKHFYFIMQFELLNEPEEEECFNYPKMLRQNPLFKEYIANEIRKRENIIGKIRENSSQANETMKRIEEEIKELRLIED